MEVVPPYVVELLQNTPKIVKKGDFGEVPKRRWNLVEGCMRAAPSGGGTSLHGRGTAEHSKMMYESHFMEKEIAISWWRSQPLRSA